MHSASVPAMFSDACSHCRSCINRSVSRLNVEYVVNPPHKPAITKTRASVPTSTRPSGPLNVAKNPSSADPVTFTNSVPHGNISPPRRAAAP